jgi:vacuolar-type H+-ATPase subunit I/STV1
VYIKQIIFMLVFSSPAFADRYGIYENNGGGSVGPIDFLLGIGFLIFSFWFLWDSYESWKKRKSSGEKVERVTLLLSLLGYAFVAFSLSFPLIMIIKFFGGAQAVKDYWLGIGVACFCVVTYLRQT